MLETKGQVTPSIEGIDQQDFQKIQVLQGAYPYLVGLQQRIPGKTIQQIYLGSVGSIYVFYLVYGRSFLFVDYGSITIIPIPIPPIVIPALPPVSRAWFDTFDEYTPIGLISFIWPEGQWYGGPGICQSTEVGYIDPFDAQILQPPGGNTPIGPPGGLGGATPSGAPGGTPIPPSPPPPPGVPQYPVDCGTMPDLPSVDVTIGSIFTGGITGVTGSNNSFTDAPSAGPPHVAYRTVSVFAPYSPSSFITHRFVENLNSFVGGSTPSGYQYRDTSTEDRTTGVFNISGQPFDAFVYLVGTKKLANGTFDIHGDGQYDTTCACLLIGLGGVVSGAVTIGTPLGVDWVPATGPDGSTAKSNAGIVEYTTVRIFSSTF